jgi:TldD protein
MLPISIANYLAAFCLMLPAGSAAFDALSFFERELKTNFAELRAAESKTGDPSLAPYFMAYRVYDTAAVRIVVNKGGIVADQTQNGRALQVEIRVGDRQVDNTHPLRESLDFAQWTGFQNVRLPLDSNAEYMRRSLRTASDFAFRSARDQYQKIAQNLRVRPATDDTGKDFSSTQAVRSRDPKTTKPITRKELAAQAEALRRVSRVFIEPSFVFSSSIDVDFRQVRKRLVTTEGTALEHVERLGTMGIYVETKADDGMVLWLSRDYAWRELRDLPTEDSLRAHAQALVAQLDSLRKAPVMETYSGPVLLRNKAAAVFVHEVFGHRVEGHRQRAVDEGQTFVQKIGHKLTLPTIRIDDDPTVQNLGPVTLNGYYRFDDEGVPARPTPLLWDGVFRDFLFSRSVVSPKGLSNGHGRAMLGKSVVARMGNTRLTTTAPLPVSVLRDSLKNTLRRLGKPYGLMVHDLSGGYTYTGRDLPQSFKLEPLYVTQIFTDGRPDRLVRGVDVVGTPLQSLAQIAAAGNDPAVFNGHCGAESGWLPVSAISPTLLMHSLEFESRSKDQNRPPILPPPKAELKAELKVQPNKTESKTTHITLPAQGLHAQDSTLLLALSREMQRSQDSLRLGHLPPPYFQSYLLWDIQPYSTQASLGSTEASGGTRQFLLDVDLRVGDTTLDNSLYQGGFVYGPSLRAPLPISGDSLLLRQAIWALTDARYKVGLEVLAQKKAYLAQTRAKMRLPDFSRQQSLVQVDKDSRNPPDTVAWRELCKRLSARLKKHGHLLESRVAYQYYYTTFYYVDAFGSVFVTALQEHTLIASLLTQAEDGTPLWDYYRIASRDSLPLGKDANGKGIDGKKPDDAFERMVGANLDSLALRLKTLMHSRPMENFRGPVLFTGPAAGDLVHRALLMPQTRLREPLGSGSEPNFLTQLRGRRYLPRGITLTDKPSQRDWKGRKLFGSYSFDHQGQPAQSLTIVEDGRLKDYYQGRVPVFAAGDRSNGHWRYGGGFPGVVRLQSTQTLPESTLVTQLRGLAQDEGLNEGLLILRTIDEDAYKLLTHPLTYHLPLSDPADGRGSFAIPAPCAMDRVDVQTGKRTPVRGLVFPAVDSKSLRGLVGVGQEPYLLEPQASFSLLCPPLLFNLLDMKQPRLNHPRLPYLP